MNVGNHRARRIGRSAAEPGGLRIKAVQQPLPTAPRPGCQFRARSSPDQDPVAIIEHVPMCAGMILRMKALTEASRALLYYCAGQVRDRGKYGRRAARNRADSSCPLIRAWGSRFGVGVAGLGIQFAAGWASSRNRRGFASSLPRSLGCPDLIKAQTGF